MEYWVQVAQAFGVPVACLVAMSLALWKVLNWVGDKVVVPVVQRHLQFMDELSIAIKRLTEDMSDMRQKVIVKAENVSIIPQHRPESVDITTPPSPTKGS